jgi:hypothetical protein
MKKLIAIPILILILFALLFCATMVGVSLRSQKSTWNDEMIMTGGNKVYEKTYQVQPDGKLIIDADVGDIIITGSDKNEVTISVTARGSEEKLKRFSVSSSQEGNTIRIDGKMKRQYLNMFGENTPNVRFDVQVPKVYNLRLNTSGGDIALDDIKGSLEGETSGGDLDLRHLEGKVRMNTSGGNVNLKSSEGDFVLETSGGNMAGDDVTGPVHLETSGGNIELQNCDGKVFASTSGGNIHAALKDNKGVELSTSGGNLSVRLPKTISADVNADASGGDVSCDFPFSGKLREGTLRGKINGGGNVIRLETSGGDIVINSLE